MEVEKERRSSINNTEYGEVKPENLGSTGWPALVRAWGSSTASYLVPAVQAVISCSELTTRHWVLGVGAK